MCRADEQGAILVNGASNHCAPGLLSHWHGLTWNHKATAGQKSQQIVGAGGAGGDSRSYVCCCSQLVIP